MYWCKIAQTQAEFTAIAKLNYATFVEEIPQHEPNASKEIKDRFHAENTYLVVYKETTIIGMLAFRDQRPFSLDEKIGAVENYLNEEHCGKLCEIRLLAVAKAYRTGRVLLKLAQALYQFAYEKDYSAAVISGTTREEKLYRQMGFTQFASAVGTEEAKFLPMVLTRQQFEQSLQQRLPKDVYTFYPGPVKQFGEIKNSNLSHRSLAFQSLYERMKQRLLQLSDANYVATFVGTGTLANEVLLGQLKTQQLGRGLILSNGEFGERLIGQARKWDLVFDCVQNAWRDPFDEKIIEAHLQMGTYNWLLFVHGETSTGTCNDLDLLTKLTKRYKVKLCADCISSFGTMPFSLENCYLATAVSGKAIGAISGLAFVFSQNIAERSTLPAYLDLANYQHEQVPFTIPAALVTNMEMALQTYPARFEQLQANFEALQQLTLVREYQLQTTSYPMIVTIKLPKKYHDLSLDLKLNGLYVHGDSLYLRQKNLVQIAVIQPDFERAFKQLKEMLTYYKLVVEA